jgi:N-acetylneuraminic acid mutarotase
VTASYGTFVYQLDGSQPGATTIARQWKYATLTDTWVSIKAIPTTRNGGAAGVATIGTNMYVLGVAPAPLNSATWYGKNEAYNTTTDTWATKAEMPSDHVRGAVGVKGNKIYVAGGPVSNKLEVYDAMADSWTSSTPATSDAQRRAALRCGFGFSRSHHCP